MGERKDGFDLREEQSRPYAFLQWKGTNACFDFYCECGAHCHFDGFFAYNVQCPHCEAIYQMPHNLFPRRVEKADGPVVRLEPTEDD